MEYNKYDIKQFWNDPNAKLINQLDLQPLTKEVLQAINKWGKVMLWPGKTSGFPAALAKQLDYQPTYEEVVQSIKQLENLGYIKFIRKQEVKKQKSTFYNVYYNADLVKIKDDLGQNERSLF